MTNTNCLENIACPQCGHADSFIIHARTAAKVTDHGAETFGDLEWDDRSFIECQNCQTGGIVTEFTREEPEQGTLDMNDYSVLLLYPDTGHSPETYYDHTEAEDPDTAIANVRAKAAAVNPGMKPEDFLPLIVLPGHIEAELFYRDLAAW